MGWGKNLASLGWFIGTWSILNVGESTNPTNPSKPPNNTWLVVKQPLWKIWVRQLGSLFPIYGKIIQMFQTTIQIRTFTQPISAPRSACWCFVSSWEVHLLEIDLWVIWVGWIPRMSGWSPARPKGWLLAESCRKSMGILLGNLW